MLSYCVFPIERGTASPSLPLSPTSPTGLKGPPGSPAPPLAALPRPSQPRTPHPTCHFPPLLSQTPGSPFSFACFPHVPRPQGRSLPPLLALATGLASSGLARCLHAPGPSQGLRVAAAASAPGRPLCPPRSPPPARSSCRQTPAAGSLPSVAHHLGPGPEAEVRRRGTARVGALPPAPSQASLR